nr:hypothetical protein [Chloroflexota bacterium]
PGLLALLAVWHNHQISPRGLHHGQSPLQRSGLPTAPTDWLTALGYPPATDSAPPPPAPCILLAAYYFNCQVHVNHVLGVILHGKDCINGPNGDIAYSQ